MIWSHSLYSHIGKYVTTNIIMNECEKYLAEIQTPPIDDWFIVNINNSLLELGGDREGLGFIAAPPDDMRSKKQGLSLEDMLTLADFIDLETYKPRDQKSVKAKEFKKTVKLYEEENLNDSRKSKDNTKSHNHEKTKKKVTFNEQQQTMINDEYLTPGFCNCDEKTNIKQDDYGSRMNHKYRGTTDHPIPFKGHIDKRISDEEKEKVMDRNRKSHANAFNGIFTHSIKNGHLDEMSEKVKRLPRASPQGSFPETKHSENVQGSYKLKSIMDNNIDMHLKANIERNLDAKEPNFNDEDREEFVILCETFDDDERENRTNNEDMQQIRGKTENKTSVSNEREETTFNNGILQKMSPHSEFISSIEHAKKCNDIKETCSPFAKKNPNEENEKPNHDDKKQNENCIVSIKTNSELYKDEDSKYIKSKISHSTTFQNNQDEKKENKELENDDKLKITKYEKCNNKEMKCDKETNAQSNEVKNFHTVVSQTSHDAFKENSAMNNNDNKQQTKDNRTGDKVRSQTNKDTNIQYTSSEQLPTIVSQMNACETKVNIECNEDGKWETEEVIDPIDIEDYVFVDAQSEFSEKPSLKSSTLLQNVKKVASTFLLSAGGNGNIHKRKDNIGNTKQKRKENSSTTKKTKSIPEGNSKLCSKNDKPMEIPRKSPENLLFTIPEENDKHSIGENHKPNFNESEKSIGLTSQQENNLEILSNKDIMKGAESHDSANRIIPASSKITSEHQSKEAEKSKRNNLADNDKPSIGVKTNEKNDTERNKKKENPSIVQERKNLNETIKGIKLTSQNANDLEVLNNTHTATKNKTEVASSNVTISTSSRTTLDQNSGNHLVDSSKSSNGVEAKENTNIKRNRKTESGNKPTYNRMTSLDLFSTLIDEMVPPSTSEDAIKIMILHSDEDSKLASDLVDKLRKSFNFRAAAACDISVLKTMSPYSYLNGAMNWADVVIPLITNTWLDNISDISSSPNRSKGSLSVRYAYMTLRNRLWNGVHSDWHVVPAVKEGTDKKYRSWPEFYNAISIWTQFSKLGRTIMDIHKLPAFIN